MLFRSGDYRKAKVEYKNALQIDPKNADAYYLLATVSEKLENWPQAMADYQKALDINPDHLKARAATGKIFLMAGDLEQADKAVKPSVQISNIPGFFIDIMLSSLVENMKRGLL